MIDLYHSVSGDQIGRALVADTEEFGYALVAMIEDAPDDLGTTIAEELPDSEAKNVVDFLRLIADQIERAFQ